MAQKEARMIRFIIVCIFVVLFLVLSMPLMLIEWIIGKFNPSLKDRSSLAIVNWAFRMVARLSGVKQTIIGEEHVPKDEPVLYIGNHQSYFDIVLTYPRVPRPTGYVAKKNMRRVPLLNVWMIFLKCQFLDRENLKEGLKTILHCIELIKSGTSICIFPEGTRNLTPDTFMEFHEGSFKIAQKSGCAIVPICINNTADIFENHFPKLKKTHIMIEYGEPFYIRDLPKEHQRAVGAYTSALIHSMYEKNSAILQGDSHPIL